MHFEGLSPPTVYNRLSKLIQSDYLESFQVNLTAHHRSDRKFNDIGVIYRITRKSLHLLRSRFDNRCRDDLVPLNYQSLYHDLALTDVIRELKYKFSDTKIINSKLLKVKAESDKQIPDAIIIDTKDQKKVALELELTSKSEARYRDIITNYQVDSEYQKVIYVVSGESIQKKIGGVITGFKNSYQRGDDTGIFEFIQLASLFPERTIKPKEVTR